MTFRASVLTLYPDMFPGPLGASLAGRSLGHEGALRVTVGTAEENARLVAALGELLPRA